MNAWHRIVAVVREAFAATGSSPVASFATTLMVAGLCATVLLTTGRTVAAEQAVLGSIDNAGTRTIVVRAEPGSGLTTNVLGRLDNIDGIEWAGAFGPAMDVSNTRVPDGGRIGARFAYSAEMHKIGLSNSVALPGKSAWGTTNALATLGLPDGAGSVISQTGIDYTVFGQFELPSWLSFLTPAVLIPQSAGAGAEVSIVVIVAERPDLVVPVSAVVQSVMGIDDRTQVSITTSEEVAKLRALVQGQLGTFGRELVLLVLGTSGFLVASILTGLVILRRKDFGRRRALGATRRLILGIVLAQTFCLATVGAFLGASIANIFLAMSGNNLPGAAFTAALFVLAVSVALVSALVPAVIAARRDPIKELRVP